MSYYTSAMISRACEKFACTWLATWLYMGPRDLTAPFHSLRFGPTRTSTALGRCRNPLALLVALHCNQHE